VKKVILILSSIIIFSTFYSCSVTKSVEEVESPSAERIVKRIEANRRKIKSFVGTGTIYVFTKELNTKSNFKVEIKKPDSLKINFFGPFGIELASALITQKDFVFLDMINNKVMKGKTNSETIKNVLKVNFPHDEIIDAATGFVNLTNKISLIPTITKNDESLYELTYPDSSNKVITKILLDVESMRLQKYFITNLNNKVLYQAEYNDYQKVDNVSIPFKIEIQDLENNQKLKIEYRKIEINKLNDKLKIEIPDDASVTEI
jgi:outer membrane lipoprotein-sorting protein